MLICPLWSKQMANDEIDNHDFEPDFDQGGDFDEFGGGQSRSSTISSTIKSSPAIKVALIGAAILVVVAAIALFGGEKVEAPSSRVDSGAKDLKEPPGTSELTPSMREAVEEHNQQILEDALKTGSSAIPTPIDSPKVLLGVAESEVGGEDPLVRWKRLQEERIRLEREQEQYVSQAQADPERVNRVNGLQQAMMNQINNIMGQQTIDPMQNLKVLDLATLEQNAAQLASQQGLAAGATGLNSVAEQTPIKVLLPAGEVVYSQLLLEANSDIPGPIVALIVSGPFNGSRVLGTFKKEEEYLIMQFNTLVSKEGHSVPINAVAVNPDTTLTGLATDVDHRYWQRIVIPAAVSFIRGMGDAIAETGSTTVTVGAGDATVSQDSSDLDTEQELAKATSEAADKVGEVLDEEADVEILVRVKAGTPMGLLFVEPVTDQDMKASQYGVNPQNAQGTQPNNNGQMMQAPGVNPFQLLQQGLNSQAMMQQGGFYPSGYPQDGGNGTFQTYSAPLQVPNQR